MPQPNDVSEDIQDPRMSTESMEFDFSINRNASLAGESGNVKAQQGSIARNAHKLRILESNL